MGIWSVDLALFCLMARRIIAWIYDGYMTGKTLQDRI
jgi:hypothetical protein